MQRKAPTIEKPWGITTAFRKMDKGPATLAYAATWVPTLAVTPAPLLLPLGGYAAARTAMTYVGKDKWDAWYDDKYGNPSGKQECKMMIRKTAGPISWIKRKIDTVNRLENLIPHAENAVTQLRDSRAQFESAKQKMPWIIGGVGALGLAGAGGAYMLGRRHGAQGEAGEVEQDEGKEVKRAYLERHYKRAYDQNPMAGPGGSMGAPAAPLNQRPGAAQMGLGPQPQQPPPQPAQPFAQGMALPKPQPGGYAASNAARRAGVPSAAPSMGAGNMGLGVASMARRMGGLKVAVDKEAATRMAREGYGALDAAMRWTRKQGPAHTEQYAKKVMKKNPERADPSFWNKLTSRRLSELRESKGALPDRHIQFDLNSVARGTQDAVASRLKGLGAPVRRSHEVMENYLNQRDEVFRRKTEAPIKKKIDGRINEVLRGDRNGYLNPNSNYSKDKYLGTLFRKGTTRKDFEEGYMGRSLRKEYNQAAAKNRRTILVAKGESGYGNFFAKPRVSQRGLIDSTNHLNKAVAREADRLRFYQRKDGEKPLAVPTPRSRSASAGPLNFGDGDFM